MSASIRSESSLGAEAPRLPVPGWENEEVIRVGYSYGKYFMHLRNPRPFDAAEKVWVRLQQEQKHWLRPHDIFRIGTLEFEILRFNVGVHREQGFRPTMEDEDVILQDIAISNWRNCSYFAIYDGHGGLDCVTYVRNHLHMNFGVALNDKGGLDKSSRVFQDICECLESSFLDTDNGFLKLVRDNDSVNSECGSAAVVCLIFGGWIWCANLGDSRALLCRDGQALQLSLDHKPDRPDERQRIEDSGGTISWGRVQGLLAISRAFGDGRCKTEPLVISRPEIRGELLTAQDEFMLMACDGVFDVFSNQDAVDFVRRHLATMPNGEQDPRETAKALAHEAIHERGSRDNVTVMLICFKRHIQIAD